MAGRIPRDFINDLIARSDIVDVVDRRVKLKKAGQNYQACCPFHNEKTPSFSVSQKKQFYHCFGCKASGNALDFIMEYDRLDFVEAVEELAKMHGLEVPREQGSKPFDKAAAQARKSQREQDYQLMEQANKFFQHQLRHHHNGAAAVDYLKQRGLSGEIVKHWEIGYAPDEWQALGDRLLPNKTLQEMGLALKLTTSNDSGKRYDFFRHRIMFPIRDRRGHVIGFGGRVLSAEQSPKYLNSPETRIFNKGSELYGFHQVRQAHRQIDRVMIVEGYMDVVALSQFGIDYAVASLGTATTPEQLQLLLRNTDEIICCYDGDNAGRTAAWRAMENALPLLIDGKTIRFLFLPDGEDPDTMVRQIGKTAFEDKLHEAITLSQFMFQQLLTEHNAATDEGKAGLRKAAQALIEQVQGDHQRDVLSEKLQSLTGDMYRYDRQRDMDKANKFKAAKNNTYQAPLKTEQSPIRLMIELLLNYPQVALACPKVQPQILPAHIPGRALLVAVHQSACQPAVSSAMIFEDLREHPQQGILDKIMQKECLVSAVDAPSVFNEMFRQVLRVHLAERTEALLLKSRTSELSSAEKIELKTLLEKQLLP